MTTASPSRNHGNGCSTASTPRGITFTAVIKWLSRKVRSARSRTPAGRDRCTPAGAGCTGAAPGPTPLPGPTPAASHRPRASAQARFKSKDVESMP